MPPIREPESGSGIAAAVKTVEALRGENGCPWDKAQTHQSLRKFLLEETYETLEAIDTLEAEPSEQNWKHFREELGDVLLQVLLHSEIASQSGHFSFDHVAQELSDKLVRRHPHVFARSETSPTTPEGVVEAWESNKKSEKQRKSALEGIPPALPALARALKVIEKVSKVGFQWPNLEGPLEKMREELSELEAEMKKSGVEKDPAGVTPEARKKIESELGDLLFTVANVAFFLGIDPESSLRTMLTRFENRFRSVEAGAAAAGKTLESMSLSEMDVLWDAAKKRER